MSVSYAYFLLLDDCILSDALTSLGQTFPLHVTIRGRFRPRQTISLSDLIGVGEHTLCQFRPFACELSGPIKVGENLWWYEIKSGADGFDTVRQAHIEIEQAVEHAEILELDHVLNSHRFEHFRPHVTIAFEPLAQEVRDKWPGRLPATLDKWALYKYDGDDVASPARMVHVSSLPSLAR